MSGLIKKLRSASGGASTAPKDTGLKSKKDEPPVEKTPLEKMLQNAGPLREDGSDKFFGYCNSIVQALYYCETFRQNVVDYPLQSPSDTPDGRPKKVNVTIRPPPNPNTAGANKQKPLTAAQAMRVRQQINAGQLPPGQQKPEDRPDSPEYKKKQAMIKGPVLELGQGNSGAYGMEESTFTGLKDIFNALIESETRTGVLSPQRFLEIFKRDNEAFRNQNHQDAHEFYGLVLNDVISNVEANARRMLESDMLNANGQAHSLDGATAALMKAQQVAGAMSPGTGWVHDIFEGVLTSETKCLACETTSQRDETFLDLSIDLEEHSSVTSCLRKFSDEEMLCERNKFHCDQCGGLQEAEKRMKIKKLPKVMALHLKRFKYTEDFTRLQKLFHRVVYPYHLRMFNTTDDAADPDRLYELYAVVVHIGGNAYHGHYIAVIKTPDRGWLLFDDEMVEPVDKHFVRNFFGDKPGMACAYVLFYQETTHEKVMAEQEEEGLEEVRIEREKADLALDRLKANGNGEAKSPLTRHVTTPTSPTDEKDNFAVLDHAETAPGFLDGPQIPSIPEEAPPPIKTYPLNPAPPPPPASPKASKEDKKLEKKEQKAAEKARKHAEKEQLKEEEKRRKENAKQIQQMRKKNEEELQRVLAESKAMSAAEEKQRKKSMAAEAIPPSPSTPSHAGHLLDRANRGSKSLSRKSLNMSWLGGGSKEKHKEKEKDREDMTAILENGKEPDPESEPSESAVVFNTVDYNGSEGARSSSNADRPSDKPDSAKQPLRERFSFSIGKKKSTVFS
ncbi:cysteine proteinase [Cryphonectria parasitica EP155]|uniref:ubiquitinyl hydrolase 1 n=1 Tax=Cryphonectria parasitica (strain ATCC 38755 / EP155) TaxID=660469 RepID=A0A9P4Y1V9_CRYP1|nr:cysteine proteinase [Cryphonectria parasitica EP155]KAF3764817.1 cysteine proteinase [Cryphonectria parasitica EP155]